MFLKRIQTGFLFSVLFIAFPVQATIYLDLNAENGTVGNSVSNPPFCQGPCSGDGESATYETSGGTPEGTKYYQWQIANNQTNHYTEIANVQSLPVNASLGNTYYLAAFFNVTRINGIDVWHESDMSGDKFIEFTGSGIRWVFSIGHWDSYCMASNQNHNFSVYISNANYHLSPSLECVDNLHQNASGFSGKNNPIQLLYDTWHSVVMGVKMSSNNSGSVTVYIDGIKVIEYNNISTAANSSPTIDYVKLGGTIAQPGYDTPAHFKKVDGLLLTDNIQDIIDGGYFLKRPKSPVAY